MVPIIIIAGVIIIIIAIIFVLLKVGKGISREQSDMDVAVLGGTYTYQKTEPTGDNVIDVY